jgi:cyclopropane-fatty-acyl-phospholipid synthase
MNRPAQRMAVETRDPLFGAPAATAEPLRQQSPPLQAGLPRAARIVFAMLARIEHGELSLRLPDGSLQRFGHGAPRAALHLRDWRVFDSALRRGDVGFAESWIAGQWDSDDLAAVLSVLVANRTVIEQAVYGSWLGRIAGHLRHLLNRNSKAGSRRNIHAHYDLGNDFYRLWLDASMTYSSALFDGHDRQVAERIAGSPVIRQVLGNADPLLLAQHAKYERILDRLDLAPGASVLEIGCGWGGFAERAAARGLRATGLTISREQYDFARARLADDAGQPRADIVLRDYRDESGRYDGIASIEMFEAVGEAYWPAWFEALRRCLKPGGRAVVQTITIDDALFDRYRRGTDFIQQYVFPGGMLPSPSRFEALAREHGFAVADAFAFGADYALTLKIWRKRFMARLDEVREQGFDERFIRTWEFYLAYCEAAFEHGSTDVWQFTLEAGR